MNQQVLQAPTRLQMDYRERRREQTRHKKLGTIVLVSATFCGIVSAWTVGAFIPIPIPFLPYVIGFFIAAGVYGGLKQRLGYDRRKASSQHLKGESAVESALPTRLVSEAPVFDDPDGEPVTRPATSEPSSSQPTRSSAGLVVCPRCQLKVVPTADGKCPSCQSPVH